MRESLRAPGRQGRRGGGQTEKKKACWRASVLEVLLTPDVLRGILLSGPMCELYIELQTVVTLEGLGGQGRARGKETGFDLNQQKPWRGGYSGNLYERERGI